MGGSGGDGVIFVGRIINSSASVKEGQAEEKSVDIVSNMFSVKDVKVMHVKPSRH